MHDRMLLGLVAGLILITAITAGGCDSSLLGGGSGGGGASGVIAPTWITPSVEGSVVSIPTSEIESGKMLHFRYSPKQGGQKAFMAYKLGDETYVRANVCPPCGSVGFSLDGNVLVCKSCGTRFSADTGTGISGACRAYPKAAVAHSSDGSQTTMEVADLVTAHQNTQKQGWP